MTREALPHRPEELRRNRLVVEGERLGAEALREQPDVVLELLDSGGAVLAAVDHAVVAELALAPVAAARAQDREDQLRREILLERQTGEVGRRDRRGVERHRLASTAPSVHGCREPLHFPVAELAAVEQIQGVEERLLALVQAERVEVLPEPVLPAERLLRYSSLENRAAGERPLWP